MQEISVTEASERLSAEEPVCLLDVREDDEVAVSALPGSVHIPMQQVPQRLGELKRDVPVLVICRMGGRSAMVTDFLHQQGFDATNIAGGMQAWAARLEPEMPVG